MASPPVGVNIPGVQLTRAFGGTIGLVPARVVTWGGTTIMRPNPVAGVWWVSAGASVRLERMECAGGNGTWYYGNTLITDATLIAYLEAATAGWPSGTVYVWRVVAHSGSENSTEYVGYGAFYGTSYRTSPDVSVAWEIGYSGVRQCRRYYESPPSGRQVQSPVDVGFEDAWWIDDDTEFRAKIAGAEASTSASVGSVGSIYDPSSLTCSHQIMGSLAEWRYLWPTGVVCAQTCNVDMAGYSEHVHYLGSPAQPIVWQTDGANGAIETRLEWTTEGASTSFSHTASVGLALDYEYRSANHEVVQVGYGGALVDGEASGGTYFDQRAFDPMVSDGFEDPVGTPKHYRLAGLPSRCESGYKSWESPSERLKQTNTFAPAIATSEAMGPADPYYAFNGTPDPSSEEYPPPDDTYILVHPQGVSGGTQSTPYYCVGQIRRAAQHDVGPRAGNTWAPGGSGGIRYQDGHTSGGEFTLGAGLLPDDTISFAPRSRYYRRIALCSRADLPHDFDHRFYLTAQDAGVGDAVEQANGILDQEDPFCYQGYSFLRVNVRTNGWSGPVALYIRHETRPVMRDPHTTSDVERTRGFRCLRAPARTVTYTWSGGLATDGSVTSLVFDLRAPDGAGGAAFATAPHLFHVLEAGLTGFDLGGAEGDAEILGFHLTEDPGYDHTGRSDGAQSEWRFHAAESFEFETDHRGYSVIWDGNPHVTSFPGEPHLGPACGVGLIEQRIDSSPLGANLNFARPLEYLALAPGGVEGITVEWDQTQLDAWLLGDQTPATRLLDPHLFNIVNDCCFDSGAATVGSNGNGNSIPIYASAVGRSWSCSPGVHYRVYVEKHSGGVVEGLVVDQATGRPFPPGDVTAAWEEVVHVRYAYYDCTGAAVDPPAGWPDANQWHFEVARPVSLSAHSVWQSYAGRAHRVFIDDSIGAYVELRYESTVWSGGNWESYDWNTQHDELQLDAQFRFSTGALAHDPRMYSWLGLAADSLIAGVASLTWPSGIECLFVVESGWVTVRRALGVAGADTDCVAYDAPQPIALGGWPSAVHLPTGEAMLVFARDDALMMRRSSDFGGTWDREETLVAGYDCPQMLVHPLTGEAFIGAYRVADAQHVVLRFVPRTMLGPWEGDEDAYGQRDDAWAEVALGTGLRTPGTWPAMAPSGRLRYIYPTDSGLAEAISDDYGTTWTVGSVS